MYLLILFILDFILIPKAIYDVVTYDNDIKAIFFLLIIYVLILVVIIKIIKSRQKFVRGKIIMYEKTYLNSKYNPLELETLLDKGEIPFEDFDNKYANISKNKISIDITEVIEYKDNYMKFKGCFSFIKINNKKIKKELKKMFKSNR